MGWGNLCGRANVRQVLTVLGMDGSNVVVTPLAQVSADGKSWRDVAEFGPDTAITGVGTSDWLTLPPTPGDFGPLVRVGLQIEQDTPTSQVAARVTWVQQPDLGAGRGALVRSVSLTNQGPGVVVVEPVDVSTFRSIALAGAAATSTTLALETSAEGNSPWFRVGDGALAVTGGSSNSLESRAVLRWVRVINVTAVAATLDVALVARAF